jgi:hypothetical protein
LLKASPRPKLDEDDGEHEHENVGDHGRNDPWQCSGERSDHAGARHRPRERADPADHDGDEPLNQVAQAEIGNSENTGTINAPARSASAAPERKVAP